MSKYTRNLLSNLAGALGVVGLLAGTTTSASQNPPIVRITPDSVEIFPEWEQETIEVPEPFDFPEPQMDFPETPDMQLELDFYQNPGSSPGSGGCGGGSNFDFTSLIQREVC